MHAPVDRGVVAAQFGRLGVQQRHVSLRLAQPARKVLAGDAGQQLDGMLGCGRVEGAAVVEETAGAGLVAMPAG